MEFEYAVAMTPREIIEHNNFLYSKHNRLKGSASSIVKNESDELIRLYHEKENAIILENSEFLKSHAITMAAWDNNTCICGAGLKEVQGEFGKYWICQDKKNTTVAHKNYVNWVINDYPKPKLYRSSGPKTYLFDIIKENEYKGKLNAKALLQFYLDNGLADLKMKYCMQSSFDHINTYTEVKKVSDAFEKECVERLTPLYTTVLPQFHVKYKLKGSTEFKVKKLDILCSNEKEVAIYECKTNVHDMDDLQRDTYIAIISYINRKSLRPVNFRYLIDTDRENYGFKKINQLETWVKNGQHFGYPYCCINSFLNNIATDRQSDLSYSTGFIPCKACCDKLINPRDLERLLVNRTCETKFPGGEFSGQEYAKLHKEGVPEYYL